MKRFFMHPLITLLHSIYQNYLRPSTNLKLKYNTEWALITGGFDQPIGIELCHELASQGLNLILISKSENRLLEFPDYLEATYKIQTKTITFDLSFLECDTEAWNFKEVLTLVLKDLNCRILINYVGMSNEGTNSYLYHTQPLWNVFNLLNVNVNTQTILTHHMVDSWANRADGKAAVITYSSIAALSP